MSDATTATTAPARSRRRLWLLAGLLAVLLVAAGAITASTLAWGDTLRAEGRLLPGTTIETVAVGGTPADDAVERLERHLATQLDRTIEVRFDADTWQTTPRELGATTDLEAVVADALDRTGSADLGDLLRLRVSGERRTVSFDVTVAVPADAVDAFVAAIAADVDREPSDAEVAWDGTSFEVTEDLAGREVDVVAAAATLGALVHDEGTSLELPVAVTAADVSTAAAEAAATAAGDAVDAALDRAVEVTLEADGRTITPRDLDAVPDVEPLLAAAFAGHHLDADDVELTIADDALTAVVTDLAAGKESAAKDAQIAFKGGSFDITPERTGLAVDRAAARAALRGALQGDTDTVALSLATVTPSVTAASFDRVLVVSQSERTVSLYRNGEATHSWPVAIGAPSSPTPKGQFRVGAKRYEPTWVNPAPTRWGKDLPARIGPGPGNPLGLRALNWNHLAGGDTLIRFHGTPNEGSIGSATSNGCVRMFNHDVVELYDLVPSGTTIVSTD